jgi:hypothetical protein
MYEKMIALIYNDNKAIGWTSTINEADMLCAKHNSYSWDYYYPHRDYVDLKQLAYLTLYSEIERE